MTKFKVGDRARALNTAHGQFTRGKEYVVSGVDEYSISIERDDRGSTTNGWGKDNFELIKPAEWKPKVGERVRFTDKCEKGWWFGPLTKNKEGVIVGPASWSGFGDDFEFDVKVEGEGTGHVAMKHIEPITATADATEAPVAAEAQPAAPAPAPLKIEAGRYYKTRDGRKVGPIVVAQGEYSPWPWKSYEGLTTYYFKDSGFSCPGSLRDHRDEDDLVALWEEPTTKASNDNGPKFKTGDRVKVTTSRHGDSQIGKTGVVINDNYRGGDLTIEIRYDTPMPSGLYHNQYSVSDLELIAAPAPTTTAIVALIENGTAKPATRPKVHASRELATAEAERLALQFPGQKFGVFVLADSKIADIVNVPTPVLRAA